MDLFAPDPKRLHEKRDAIGLLRVDFAPGKVGQCGRGERARAIQTDPSIEVIRQAAC